MQRHDIVTPAVIQLCNGGPPQTPEALRTLIGLHCSKFPTLQHDFVRFLQAITTWKLMPNNNTRALSATGAGTKNCVCTCQQVVLGSSPGSLMCWHANMLLRHGKYNDRQQLAVLVCCSNCSLVQKRCCSTAYLHPRVMRSVTAMYWQSMLVPYSAQQSQPTSLSIRQHWYSTITKMTTTKTATTEGTTAAEITETKTPIFIVSFFMCYIHCHVNVYLYICLI